MLGEPDHPLQGKDLTSLVPESLPTWQSSFSTQAESLCILPSRNITACYWNYSKAPITFLGAHRRLKYLIDIFVPEVLGPS